MRITPSAPSLTATRPSGRGKIVKLEWVNPHTWIHLEITTDERSGEVWVVEGGTPNVLRRRGSRRDCLPPLHPRSTDSRFYPERQPSEPD